MIDRALALIDAGGPVAYVLVVVSAVMWGAIVLRAFVLSRVGEGPAPRDVIQQRAWRMRELDACDAYAAALHSLVTAGPLLGLLGTVSGMIDTFASLRPQGVAATHATEQTIAGGISVALITTQLGLAVGIAGVLAAHALDRWAARRRAVVLARSPQTLTPGEDGVLV